MIGAAESQTKPAFKKFLRPTICLTDELLKTTLIKSMK